jgi:hypothetical protein
MYRKKKLKIKERVLGHFHEKFPKVVIWHKIKDFSFKFYVDNKKEF